MNKNQLSEKKIIITKSQMLLLQELERINEALIKLKEITIELRKKFQPDETIKCCLCNEIVNEFGNNAEPLIEDGICCNKCNWEKVIPARIKE
jgi:hypothetical protein